MKSQKIYTHVIVVGRSRGVKNKYKLSEANVFRLIFLVFYIVDLTVSGGRRSVGTRVSTCEVTRVRLARRRAETIVRGWRASAAVFFEP